VTTVLKSVNNWIQVQTSTIPTFNSATDPINIFTGLVSGAVSVLPKNSMIAYCNGNFSAIYSKGLSVYTDFSALNIPKGMTDLQAFFKALNGIIFNCYYTATDPIQAAAYNK
jgi:hypothetical protein